MTDCLQFGVIVIEWLHCGSVVCVQFTGSIEAAKQLIVRHLDDAFRAARALHMTQKEVMITLTLLIKMSDAESVPAE